MNTADNDDAKALREEIIESQKTQADFLKWKLIAAAALGSISLGLLSNGKLAAESTKLLICLVPFLCIYVDLLSFHIMIRILTIGAFLRCRGSEYERFVFSTRVRKTNPFVFEIAALHGSSFIFNTLLIVLGFTLPMGAGGWPPQYLMAYIASGAIGIAGSMLSWYIYASRAKEIVRRAEALYPPASKESALSSPKPASRADAGGGA